MAGGGGGVKGDSKGGVGEEGMLINTLVCS